MRCEARRGEANIYENLTLQGAGPRGAGSGEPVAARAAGLAVRGQRAYRPQWRRA